MINPEDLKNPYLFNADGLPRNLVWGISDEDNATAMRGSDVG